MPDDVIAPDSNPTTGGAMLYQDSEGRLQLARERVAELARDYERRRRAPEPRRARAALQEPGPRLRLVHGRDSSHESAGA
jgi:hypothetical protein